MFLLQQQFNFLADEKNDFHSFLIFPNHSQGIPLLKNSDGDWHLTLEIEIHTLLERTLLLTGICKSSCVRMADHGVKSTIICAFRGKAIVYLKEALQGYIKDYIFCNEMCPV